MRRFAKTRELVGRDERHVFVAAPADDGDLSTLFDLVPDLGEVITGMAVSDGKGHWLLGDNILVQKYCTDIPRSCQLVLRRHRALHTMSCFVAPAPKGVPSYDASFSSIAKPLYPSSASSSRGKYMRMSSEPVSSASRPGSWW